LKNFYEMANRIRQKQRPPVPSDRELLEDMREVRRQLDAVQSFFAMESDEDLLDAAIYQREALHARYRYLLRLAKETGVRSEQLPIIPENRTRQIN